MKASANNRPQKLSISSSGFTLIELMVTIAVLAIIVGIAAPNISTQLANQRVKSTAATLANALTEAKVESVLRRQNIMVVYGNSSAPKTIKLQANGNEISSYNISDKSTVTQMITPSTVTNIVFQPNKRIANNATVVYTICDSGSNSETPRQVSLTNIANVNTINAGIC
ncbi:pilus assembly protein [Psychrobacter sp. G]|uniref:GspH/FimT family pseudopilin n=1 Tax=Psychrobacter sp. G TaxID=571800 RepID=UPI000354BC2F|nr:prepilin-type N-terminal cleavage/methylation domain-containing protein [Psychrobacter sp. G]AGP47887.1 pilus assembly protein [Psychrobacter sp. G]